MGGEERALKPDNPLSIWHILEVDTKGHSFCGGKRGSLLKAGLVFYIITISYSSASDRTPSEKKERGGRFRLSTCVRDLV